MKEWKEWFTGIIRGRKKEHIITVVLLVLLGIVIIWPAQERGPADSKEADQEETAGTQIAASNEIEAMRIRMEEELEETLSLVEGVGSVEVVITLETTGTRTVEKDVPESSSSSSTKGQDGSTQENTQRETQETTVFVTENDGSQSPYIVSETLPEVRGVLVIAEGGKDPVIVEQIQEAVMALFHVEAHKIKVMKRK